MLGSRGSHSRDLHFLPVPQIPELQELLGDGYSSEENVGVRGFRLKFLFYVLNYSS